MTRAQAEPASRDSLIDPWRVMRITAEFVEGFDALAGIRKGVTIFGSARTGPDDPQYAAAHETARLLARQGFSILFGRAYWAGLIEWIDAHEAQAAAKGGAPKSGLTLSGLIR